MEATESLSQGQAAAIAAATAAAENLAQRAREAFAAATAAAAAAAEPHSPTLKPEYGWVLLVLLLAVLLQLLLAFNVVRARIRFGVKPPETYAVKGVTGRGGELSEDANASLLRLSARECDLFNCYQRAHQHAVEMYTIFIPLLLAGGLASPLASAFGGFLFLLGTFVYALGYYSGEAANRKWGSFQLVGLVICMATTLLQAIQLLRSA